MCEILLFGADEGIDVVAHEYDVTHIKQITTNEYGTPLLDHVFSLAQNLAKYKTLMYINTDIIIYPDIIVSINKIKLPSYIMSGRRIDLDIHHEINFTNKVESAMIKESAFKNGKLHGSSGMDYYIFPNNLIEMPPFSVGRQGWDSWLIHHMKERGVPIIDATKGITVIHQNHDFSHSQYGGKKRVGGPELIQNINIAGGFSNISTLRDADWRLLKQKNGLSRQRIMLRIFTLLFSSTIGKWLIRLKRKNNYLEQ